MGVVITRLRIKQYKGVEEMDLPIEPAGAIFAGRNAGGKTSILDSLRAALAGEGIGPDAIRLGATASEILVDLDAASVRRVITQKGSTVTVTGHDGEAVKRPVEWLRGLLGTAALDPIGLFQEHDRKKRKAIILGALPVKVTDDHLRAWLGSRYGELPAGLRDAVLRLHGLEAVSSVRDHFYGVRAQANATAKQHAGELATLEAEVEKLAPPAPAAKQGTLTLVGGKTKKKAPATSQEDAGAELAKAQDAVSKAVQAKANLEAQERAAAAQSTKMASTRAAIEEKRRKARASLAALPPVTDADEVVALFDAATDHLAEAEREFNEAKALHERARARMDDLEGNLRSRAAAKHEEDAANEMEAALLAAAVVPPSLDLLAKADAEVATAQAAAENAKGGVRVAELRSVVESKRAQARDSETHAGQLTALVDKLSKEAPAQLIAESGAIAGLEVTDDAIKLDGVAIDGLSGKEQLVFAVEISKRANGSAKLLIVDGLERLDGEQTEHFVEACTKGGFQLLGTRVADGDVVVEHLTVDSAEEKAS